MIIEHTRSPDNTDVDFLTQRINEETPEYGEAYPFGFFMRNEAGELIAGCNGSVIFGAIYTDQLWVHPNHRRQGLGQKLMESVHAYGRRVGCTMATLATMSFQGAQNFYERLGYVHDFERQGYVKGASCLFLRKVL